jgi:hypothetical protein
MKRVFILLVCVIITGIFTGGCKSIEKTPAQPATNDSRITILPVTDDTDGSISFKDVTLTKSILEKDYFAPWAGNHKKGEPCFLVTGQIVNNSGKRYWVAHFIDGFDDAGNRVAGTLDSGPIVGIAQIGIEPHSSENFTLHLGWSDNATSFTLQSQKSAQMFP